MSESKNELKIKIDRAIRYLQTFEPKDEPYYLCYSGGKDSDAIRILAEMAGVKYEIHHNLTTVDAPETVQYVKSIPGIIIHRPEKTMWRLIEEKLMPPTRVVRYCCQKLKEGGGKGRVKITGVRWAESAKRKAIHGVVTVSGKPKTMQKLARTENVEHTESKYGLTINNDNNESRKFVEICYRDVSTTVNPIVDWTDDDVWEFLHRQGCDSNPLYKQGFKRIGCIGCPLAGGKQMQKELDTWPKYKQAYLRAFSGMLKRRKEKGLPCRGWDDAQDVMRWWLRDEK